MSFRGKFEGIAKSLSCSAGRKTWRLTVIPHRSATTDEEGFLEEESDREDGLGLRPDSEASQDCAFAVLDDYE